MADEAYAAQSDLERALGGAAVLVQLADPNKTGNVDSNTVTDLLNDGAAELRSAVEVKHDPEVIANLDTASRRLLAKTNAALSARIAYERGSKGLAMPDNVARAAERADKFCDQLASGERRLARVAGGKVAAVSQAADDGIVDHDPLTTAKIDTVTTPPSISIAQFKLGFR